MLPNRATPFIFALVLLITSSGCDRGSHPSQIGKLAPDFTIHDSSTTVRLDSFRGKVVVLNFWATWCPPCLQELPTLIALQRRLPQVVVLAVSTDQEEAPYRQFLSEHPIDLLKIRDGKQESSTLYGTFRYPETYIIDQNGVLRRKFIGPQNWMSPEIISYLQGI